MNETYIAWIRGLLELIPGEILNSPLDPDDEASITYWEALLKLMEKLENP